MNLIDEEEQKIKKGTNGLQKIIIAAILIILMIIIGIMAYLYVLRSSVLIITIDGIQNQEFGNLLVFKENGKVYMPIKEVSKYFGAIESYNGHYEDRSENKSKVYIKTEQEAINFTLDISDIEKLNLESNTKSYDIISTDDKVEEMDGILYASSDMIAEAFNLSFEYDQKTNKVEIYTLPYLAESYSAWAIQNGYSRISEKFDNQKAMLDNKLIVLDTNETQYGVIDLATSEIILEPKYEDITYLAHTQDYLIQTNEKKGIVNAEAQLKIPVKYDNIEVLDNDANLYLISKNGEYGVSNFDGETMIYVEYDQIGIDMGKFNQPDIKNEYLLVGNLIPVKKDEKWALFNKEGKQVSEFKYDRIGYEGSSSRDIMSMLIVPEYNVIVVGANGKYALINSKGEELFGPIADDIYMTIENGEKKYYILLGNKKLDLEEELQKRGVNIEPNNQEKEKEEKN